MKLTKKGTLLSTLLSKLQIWEFVKIFVWKVQTEVLKIKQPIHLKVWQKCSCLHSQISRLSFQFFRNPGILDVLLVSYLLCQSKNQRELKFYSHFCSFSFSLIKFLWLNLYLTFTILWFQLLCVWQN